MDVVTYREVGHPAALSGIVWMHGIPGVRLCLFCVGYLGTTSRLALPGMALGSQATATVR